MVRTQVRQYRQLDSGRPARHPLPDRRRPCLSEQERHGALCPEPGVLRIEAGRGQEQEGGAAVPDPGAGPDRLANAEAPGAVLAVADRRGGVRKEESESRRRFPAKVGLASCSAVPHNLQELAARDVALDWAGAPLQCDVCFHGSTVSSKSWRILSKKNDRFARNNRVPWRQVRSGVLDSECCHRKIVQPSVDQAPLLP